LNFIEIRFISSLAHSTMYLISDNWIDIIVFPRLKTGHTPTIPCGNKTHHIKKNMTSNKDWCHESLINHHNRIFQISYTLITKNILIHSLSIYHFISCPSISVCVCVEDYFYLLYYNNTVMITNMLNNFLHALPRPTGVSQICDHIGKNVNERWIAMTVIYWEMSEVCVWILLDSLIV
jgi:hypothetical protein